MRAVQVLGWGMVYVNGLSHVVVGGAERSTSHASLMLASKVSAYPWQRVQPDFHYYRRFSVRSS